MADSAEDSAAANDQAQALLALTADIVAAHASNNGVSSGRGRNPTLSISSLNQPVSNPNLLLSENLRCSGAQAYQWSAPAECEIVR